MPEWVIRTADNVFLRDKGREGIIAGEAVVTVATVPPRGTRYDATSPTGYRAATRDELIAESAEKTEARLAAAPDTFLLRAVAQLDYEERQKCVLVDGQTFLTPLECEARIKLIYRSLRGA